MRVVTTGWRYGLAPLLLAPPVTLVSPPIGLGLFALGLGVLWFFRDPIRSPPNTGIISPADGQVSLIREEDDRVRVGVFMNVTDVHVNRSPIAGPVTKRTHRPGAHRPAFSKDSDRNERVDMRIEGPEHTVDVSLIAGAFARRISPYVREGDILARGQRIGHIAFGSRADVLLPPAIDVDDVAVAVGERVRAGESQLVTPEAIDRPETNTER